MTPEFLQLEKRLKLIINENFQDKDCTLDRELKGKQVLIYGCGNMGYLTLNKIRHFNNIAGIIDEAGEKAKYYNMAVSLGIPVFRLGEEPENVKKQQPDFIVLVAVCMQYEKYNNFKKSLEERGYRNIYYSRMYSYEQVYKECAPEIEKGFNLLCDVQSKELYLDLLDTGGGIKNILNKDWETCGEEQYFPHDIQMRKGYGRFVDCGSYVGDTIERLMDKGKNVHAVAAFEPGKANYDCLEKVLETAPIKEKASFPYAVGEKEQYVNFNDELGDGSCCVSENSGDMIKMVALDDCIPDFKPTMIKMDIEGSEIDAIKGAKNLISQNQPDLAICVYHQFNHLWKASCLLHDICPEYKFYLRCYGFEGGETVLYATV